MARVKLSEYRAKQLIVSDYKGVALRLDNLDDGLSKLEPTTNYVVKVDQGVKKRGKQGLLKLGLKSNQVRSAIEELSRRGFTRYVAEPMVEHDDSQEHYLSFERTRQGIVISYSPKGGVDVEDHADEIESFAATSLPESLAVDRELIDHIIEIMNRQHLSFVEINPLVIQGDVHRLLDAAVLADSAALHLTDWDESDIVESEEKHAAEVAIKALQASSPASFTLRILNANAPLWLLLSGGGASITLADEAANHGRADTIGNYGEYSGGPSTAETYLYARQVLSCLIDSSAPKKALVVAGGVANFTDVRKTFDGIIQALEEVLPELQDQSVRIFVRRGGPHETEGLKLMRDYLEKHGLLGSVHGSSDILTTVINEALEYIDA